MVYQIFPDRFARSAAADERPTPAWAHPAEWTDTVLFEGSDPLMPVQLFGGDLDGITDHLDHVERVGADIVYTTPVFPGESNHRYNATTFTEVDPLLGGDAAYERLSTAVHARGWRILGDLTTNHTGDTHEWFLSARDDPSSPTRTYYYFDHDGTYASWMGHDTLPKVNHGDPDLRAAMVEGPDSVVGRWLQPPYDVDGWRIDVANMTGRLGTLDVAHEVARAVRRTAESLREDPLVIGEHNHDASGDVDGDGWHGTMNYSGFSWPVWSWLRSTDTTARAFGRPVQVARRRGPEVVDTFRAWQGSPRLAGHDDELEHPRLPRLRPHPHHGRWRRRAAPRRGRPAVHDARSPDALRRRRARPRGRQRRGLASPDAMAHVVVAGTRRRWTSTRTWRAYAAPAPPYVAADSAGRTSTTTPSPSCASTTTVRCWWWPVVRRARPSPSRSRSTPTCWGPSPGCLSLPDPR